jgi:hypothetical protein
MLLAEVHQTQKVTKMSDSTAQQSPPTNSRLMLLGTLLVGIVATFVVVYSLTNRPRNTSATPL